ncbi:hypothetical protein DP20_1335 [Shigella flexneri]|nr:hypothetical protein DP20_1335 [Shigella flexneri]
MSFNGQILPLNSLLLLIYRVKRWDNLSSKQIIVFGIKITDRYITCVYLSALKLLRR